MDKELPQKLGLINFWGFVLGAVVILGLLACYLRLIFMPLSTKITFLADDGFYYLVLARNFAQSYQWSFDHGISFTSGFHLLFGYLLVFLYKIFPGQLQFIQAALVAELISFMASFFIIAKAAMRFQSPIILLAFSLLAVASSSWSAWTSLVEWPFVILFASLFYYCYRFTININPVLFLFIGIFGSFARSDFGLMPFCIFISAFVFYKAHKNRLLLLQSGMTLLGSVLGVIAVIIHSLISTGQIVQGSALMKTFWTEVGGKNIEPIVRLVTSILPGNLAVDHQLLHTTSLIIFALFGFTGLVLAFKQSILYLKVAHEQNKILNIILLTGSITTIIAYLIFYMFNSMGIAYWYTANFFVPLTVIIAFIFFQLNKQKLLTSVFYLACTLLIAFQLGVIFKSPHGLYTWHNAIMQAANYISEHYPKARIGCWSAGIPGYFAGENVFIINVDGLMNNDIYTHAKKGAFLDYLKSRKITYIADWPKQIPSCARLSGYMGNDFEKHLTPIKTFPDECPQEFFTTYTIYEFTK
jgi:hypothetical protein